MSPPYQRYLQVRLDAYKQAIQNLRSHVTCDFNIVEINNRAYEAVLDQWDRHGRNLDADWDWRELMRRYRDPDRLDIAIWSGSDRIACLALGVTTGPAVELKFLEADPRADCPLRGKRALIALETVSCYAQARGKREIRVRPVNETVARLYRDVYGFDPVTQPKAASYFMRRV